MGVLRTMRVMRVLRELRVKDVMRAMRVCAYCAARAMGLGLGCLASEADLLHLPSTLSIVTGGSGDRLRCLLELRISLGYCATFMIKDNNSVCKKNLSPSFREAGAPSSGIIILN